MPSAPKRTEEEKMAILEGDRLMELGNIEGAESNYQEAREVSQGRALQDAREEP